MIGIINYGMGNINAFSNIYNELKVPYKVISNKEDFKKIDKIILPGVGAFDSALTKLKESNLLEILKAEVLEKKKKILGVCVGMQLMAKTSEEGNLNGLGWIDATVNKFDKDILKNENPIPHMGWNSIQYNNENPLFKDIKTNSRFYFLHSYYFKPLHELSTIAVSNYGLQFSCAINMDNIFGVQFHPEKSHINGIKILKNFSNL